MRAIKEECKMLPVNLIFVIEGEEEYGSRSLPQFFNMHLNELKKAGAVVFPFFGL